MFKGKRVFTLYRNQSKIYKEFTIDDFTIAGCNLLLAYKNITVQTHYFVRHRLILHNPRIQCVMLYVKGDVYLYPLEFISLVPYQEHYTRTDPFGMSTLKSRHFKKKHDYRIYLEQIRSYKIPRLIGCYPKKVPANWTLEKMMKEHPEKVHPFCKSTNSNDIKHGIKRLCNKFSNLKISADSGLDVSLGLDVALHKKSKPNLDSSVDVEMEGINFYVF
jgi:hypothetical protein